MVSIIILIAVVVLLAIFIVGIYNSLVKLSNKVKEAFSIMDVYLKQRFDLIPNLVEIVKGYAKYESETLEEITKLRTNVGSGNINGKVEGEMSIGQALSRLMLVVEKYPELKANEHFLDLQGRLVKIEEEIAFSRRYFNGSVRQYNDKCQMFPYNVVAGIFGFKSKRMYEVEKENERNAIDINM